MTLNSKYNKPHHVYTRNEHATCNEATAGGKHNKPHLLF